VGSRRTLESMGILIKVYALVADYWKYGAVNYSKQIIKRVVEIIVDKCIGSLTH
jgi:hypothetical protein